MTYTHRTGTPFHFRETPFIGFLILRDLRSKTRSSDDTHFIVQGFDFFLSFTFTYLVRGSDLEKLRSNVDEPFWFDSSDCMTILSCGQNQFVINEPFRRMIEQRTRRMDIDWRSFDQCFVSFLRVFFCCISEKT